MCPPGEQDPLSPERAAGAPPSVAPGAGGELPRPGPLTLMLLLAALVVGIGVRLGLAWHQASTAAEWEADGFATAWLGRPWAALNRERAPGFPLLLAAVAREVPSASLFEVRVLSVGLSVLSLLCAWACAAAVAALTGVRRPSVLRACAWMTALWAIHPTLLASAVAPTPEVLVGGSACLLLASLANIRARPGLPAVVLTGVCGAAFACTAGLGGAVALVVAVVVYLLPVPAFGRGALAVVLLAGVLATGFWAQRGPDTSRPWLPDTAWARSLSALAGQAPPYPDDIPSHADRRARHTLALAQRAVLDTPPLELGQQVVRRLGFDLLGPRRLEPLLDASAQTTDGTTRRALLLGFDYLDLFLRGGLLLFACAVLGMLATRTKACWPRAALVTGGLAWLLVLVVSAIGPLALAPFDLVLLGVAGAGVAGTDPRRVWTRRLAFGLGGLLLCSLLASAGLGDRPLPSWLLDLDQRGQEGRQLVGLLADGGPTSAEDSLHAADLLSRFSAPLQRLPEPALALSDAALRELASGPLADDAIELLVRAQVECLLYAEAAELAESYHASKGREPDKRSMMLLEWVQTEQRHAENLPVRRP